MAQIIKISDYGNLELSLLLSFIEIYIMLKCYGECITIHHSMVCDSYINTDQGSCDVHMRCVY